MKESLERIETEALKSIEQAENMEQIEEIRIKYLGKKGELTSILKSLGDLPRAERPVMGKMANRVKNRISGAIDRKIEDLQKKILEEEILARRIDITLPGKKVEAGTYHPITRILDKIHEIFMGMGFSLVEGPEVETEYYNFESLNIPADHPSREMWDSFYFGDNLLLRSHTSPVQVRVMEKTRPPVKIIVPGKCYRRDEVDATHHWMFQQVEGLLVDTRVTFADLKGVLLHFAREMFGEERRVKFIPSYFPFTEPSAEMAIDCFQCQGEGCRVCKNTGWIEILGSGMVNPNVLKEVDYDPEVYTGFAFGVGVDRIAMLKFGIEDIRLFYEDDVRFLEQFSGIL